MVTKIRHSISCIWSTLELIKHIMPLWYVYIYLHTFKNVSTNAVPTTESENIQWIIVINMVINAEILRKILVVQFFM
jgi:hypothetical protein